jgi:ferrous iron transport protein B
VKKHFVIALAGNPNCGKSSIFNNLTGARQHVGNWPGVTVEKKEGTCDYGACTMKVVDLPGTYSLAAHSLDEVIARDFMLEEKPDVVVNILDASNLERNLYLTVQLLEMEVPLIICLNMIDVAESRGHKIDVNQLSELLHVPVIPTVGHRNQGMRELLEAVVSFAAQSAIREPIHIRYGDEVEEEITKIENVITKNDLIVQGYPLRWFALKLLEGDERIAKQVGGNQET